MINLQLVNAALDLAYIEKRLTGSASQEIIDGLAYLRGQMISEMNTDTAQEFVRLSKDGC